MYQKWYFEITVDHIEQTTHMMPHLRIGWANTSGYVPYPGGGKKWGGNGVGDDLYSFGFDGAYLWTGGKKTQVYHDIPAEPFIRKGDVVGVSIDLNIPVINFTFNGNKIKSSFRNFNLDGMFFPVMSCSSKIRYTQYTYIIRYFHFVNNLFCIIFEVRDFYLVVIMVDLNILHHLVVHR